MNRNEARYIINAFYQKRNPNEDERFQFIESLDYMIAETKDSRYIMELGGYYYGEKDYRLARKYYEMAAEYGNQDAYAGLGYIYYYGRTGEPDYEKAFYYYTKASEAGDIQCTYKLADMYRNGYYVEKNENQYREMIESLYPKIKNATRLSEPLPEIFTRLAKIRAQQGRTEEALELYWAARDFLSQRICYNPFFGNLSIMKWLITDLYQLQEIDLFDFSLYDLYYLLKTPNKVTFVYRGQHYTVESLLENGCCVIRFDGAWYRTPDDFFAKASIQGKLLTTIENKLYQFELVNENE